MAEDKKQKVVQDMEARRDLEKRKAILTAFIKVAVGFFFLIFVYATFMGVFQGLTPPAIRVFYLMYAAVILLTLDFVVLKKTSSPLIAGNIFTGILYSVGLASIFWQRGEFAPLNAWVVVLPVLATMVAGKRSGIAWAIIVVLSFLAADLFERAGYAFHYYPVEINVFAAQAAIVLLICLLAMTAFIYERYNDESMTYIRSLSVKDEQTRLCNQRGFMFLADKQMKQAKRDNKIFSIMFFDIDKLNRINDIRGREEGDVVLADVANILASSVRASDLVTRLGEDEFAVAANITGENETDLIKKRINELLEKYRTERAKPYKLSLNSATVLKKPDEMKSLHDMLEEADSLMYEKKRGTARGGGLS